MKTFNGLVGFWIRNLLYNDSIVRGLVYTKIFPFITKTPQNFPWIVYTDIQVQYDETFDSNEPSSATANILCVADTYEKSLDICEAVANAIDQKKVSNAQSETKADISILSIDSDYDDEMQGFIQTINIKFSFY